MTTASTYFHRDERPVAVPIWREVLASLDWMLLWSSPVFYGCGVQRGDGSAVVVVPGFLGTDSYLLAMYYWLQRIGYRPYLSRIGRNADCLNILMGRLFETVDAAGEKTGGKVHLIGHSLGGLLSRAAAARRPQRVASVITLGSPFRGLRSHPFVMRMTEEVRARIHSQHGGQVQANCFTGYCGCETLGALQQALPPSVPQAAIYTRTDGVTDWRFCIKDDPETDFEVSGTHAGLAFNSAVYRLIADRLATASAKARKPEEGAGHRV